jgi:hypothetical protein
MSGEANEVEEPEPGTNDLSNNTSDSGVVDESPSPAPGAPNSKTPGDGQRNSSFVEHKATGPRTKEGKERTKHNAVKHGIFSNEVLLDTEIEWKFNSLLRGLRADFKPDGTLEGILVEKLASLI